MEEWNCGIMEGKNLSGSIGTGRVCMHKVSLNSL